MYVGMHQLDHSSCELSIANNEFKIHRINSIIQQKSWIIWNMQDNKIFNL